MKMIFKCIRDDESNVTFIAEDVALDNIVYNFKFFLKGCGFIFHDLEVIENAEDND